MSPKAFSRVLDRCYSIADDDGGALEVGLGWLAMPSWWYLVDYWSYCWCCWAMYCYCIDSRAYCASRSIWRIDWRSRASASSSRGRAAKSIIRSDSPTAKPAYMERMNMDLRHTESSHSRSSARDPRNSGRTEPSRSTSTKRNRWSSRLSKDNCCCRAIAMAVGAVFDTPRIDIDYIVDM